MTTQPIHHGEAGVQLNKRPEAAAPHAYVENGALYVMDGGQYWRCSYNEAWSLWLTAAHSTTASTQERARQIRAAMDEAYPQKAAA